MQQDYLKMIRHKSKGIKYHKKIDLGQFLRALGFIGLSTLVAECGTSTRDSLRKRLDAVIQKSQLNKEKLIRLHNGYITDNQTYEDLRTVAGIYARTVTIKKTANGYVLRGLYDEGNYPEAMDNACKNADTNMDFIVTLLTFKKRKRKNQGLGKLPGSYILIVSSISHLLHLIFRV